MNDWITAAGISTGSLFRRVSSAGRVWGEAVREKLVWHVVKEFAAKIGVSKLAPPICGGVALASVVPPAANWNRFSFCWVMFRCRLQSVTSAAPSGFHPQ